MRHFQYLALLAGCLLVTVPLEWIYGFRVWRDPGRLLRAVVPGVIVFTIWDLVAIHRRHWGFDPGSITGVEVPGGMPLEELLFFFVVPICGLCSYEAVRASLRRMVRQRQVDADA